MFHNSRCLLVFLVFDNPFGGHRKPKYPLQTGMTTLDSYQLNLVQKTQEILCNALKSSDGGHPLKGKSREKTPLHEKK
jgi:hypothetical protein